MSLRRKPYASKLLTPSGTISFDGRRLLGLDPAIFIGFIGILVIYVGYCVLRDGGTPTTVTLRVIAAGIIVPAFAWATLKAGVDLSRRSALSSAGAMVAGIALFSTTWGPGFLQEYNHWAYTSMLLLMAILCLRGRLWEAISLQLITATVYFVRAVQVTGNVEEISFYLIGNAPFFIITLYISSYVRPTVRDILALRDARHAAVRAEAAAVAALQARNTRLDWIDQTAGPWLRRLAARTELTKDEMTDCQHLESGIRDCLRAPGLTGPELDVVVDRARRRGVDIILIDDGALDNASAAQRSALRRSVAALIEPLERGRATVRIGPPGRPEIATIRSGQEDTMQRSTFRMSDLDFPSSTP